MLRRHYDCCILDVGYHIVGGASAFIESTLAQIYKKRGEHSSYGGPAYYIEAALNSRALAVLFSMSLIATYGVGFPICCVLITCNLLLLLTNSIIRKLLLWVIGAV